MVIFWFIVPDVHRFRAKHLESFGRLAKKNCIFFLQKKKRAFVWPVNS